MKRHCEADPSCANPCEHRRLPPWEIKDYSIDNFVDAVAANSKASREFVLLKNHVTYLEGYFAHKSIAAKTMVIEHDYIDQGYLDDFAEYYVHCFSHYKKRCTRIHFFRSSFSSDFFDNLLQGIPPAGTTLRKAQGFLRKKYCGFIVIKPLPETVFGRTCLKTYPELPKRHYRGITSFKANLFGLELEVASLPFQEQDRVVAACATSALWSVLHSTSRKLNHSVLSPAAITKIAYQALPNSDGQFPSLGLAMDQMSCAMRAVGLEVDVFTAVTDISLFKSSLYAYLRNGLPILFVFMCAESSADKQLVLDTDDLHAVAVTGYRREQGKAGAPRNPCPGDFCLRAERIDRIYAHDDGVGPFAKMVFQEHEGSIINARTEEIIAPDEVAPYFLSTSWPAERGSNLRAVPAYLLVPLPYAVKLKFGSIHDVIDSFSGAVDRAWRCLLTSEESIEWSIYLTSTNELKKELLSESDKSGLQGSSLKDTLLRGFPKYVWRARALTGEQCRQEFIFDATAIEQDSYMLHTIRYDELFWELTIDTLQQQIVQQKLREAAGVKVLEWFVREELVTSKP